MRGKCVTASSALLLLAACGPSDEPKNQTAHQSSPAAEANSKEKALLSDLAAAIPELARRLRQNVSLKEGVLVVDSVSMVRLVNPATADSLGSVPGSITVSALPRQTQWVVNCGVGVTVTFGGASPSKVADELSWDSKLVWLTLVPLTRSQCETFVPALGKEVQALIDGK